MKYCILFLLVCVTRVSFATTWANVYGGVNSDSGYSVQQTSDKGYIIAGITYSYGVIGEEVDFLVIKLDSLGDIQWAKAYGGTQWEGAFSIQQTSDGGYIVAGTTKSFGVGNEDVLVIKLDSAGNIIWAKTYGGTQSDGAYSVQQIPDDEYIVAGYTNSYGTGGTDFLVMRLNSMGGVVWSNAYGGGGFDEARCIRYTLDGFYIVAGYTTSFGVGEEDFLVIKLNPAGTVLWSKTYGIPGATCSDKAYCIQPTIDGGYVVVGSTELNNTLKGLIITLDTSGNVTVTLPPSIYFMNTTGNEEARYVRQTIDGGYVVAGYTTSSGAGGSDFLVIGFGSWGTPIWMKTYGDTTDEIAHSIWQTSDTGYIVVGDGRIPGSGNFDVWAVKTNTWGIVPENSGTDSCLGFDCRLHFDKRNVELTTPIINPVKGPIAADCSPEVRSFTLPIRDICEKVAVEEMEIKKGEAEISIMPTVGKKFNVRFTVNDAHSKCGKLSSRILLTGKEEAKVTITLYDNVGREVCRLFEGYKLPGSYNLSWNGKDSNGKGVRGGVYFCKLKLKNQELEVSRTAKLILLQ